MEVSGAAAGKSPNASLSFRYNANNEELEELFNACEDDPPTPQCDTPSTAQSENASPKRGDRTPSIIDKYFKSMRSEKPTEKEKTEEVKPEAKDKEDSRSSTPKEVTASPMKEYLNRLGKRSTPEVNPDVRESSNETWKIFHDFKFKIAQAVEDMKTKSLEETKDDKKTLQRDNSASDSEENSALKDIDQQSFGDTDNQVSSLDSSMQNLSEVTQPITAKPIEQDLSFPMEKTNSDSSDDTHKNLVYSEMMDERDFLTDSLLDVESGIEAIEDPIDVFGEIPKAPVYPNSSPGETTTKPKTKSANAGLPPSNSDLLKNNQNQTPKSYFCNFTMYFITVFFLINLLLFPKSNYWIGFLLGIWFFLLVGNIKQWVLDNYFSDWDPKERRFFRVKRSSAMPTTYTIPSVKEHMPLKKYEGWINHYRYPDYDPMDYHINKSTTAFMKLEGINLRISYTRVKVAKRQLWDEKLDKITFYQHRLYNLAGARVILLPNGLVKRRLWSKKYPICVVLNEKEKIQVLEKENTEAERRVAEALEKKKEHHFETESTETNTSPEKKKKFVWRRKDKNPPHPETSEQGKEGLRHRLVRKMHRDKKTDSVSTCTEPVETEEKRHQKSVEDLTDEMELATKSTTSNRDEEDVEIDDNEMTKIKEFLEEAHSMENADEANAEGEWSVHVKSSKDKHSNIYLFARTGRDKFEWFRRLCTAISDANIASTESSTSEEIVPETPGENKEPIELAVFKMTEKDTVAFAKSTTKSDALSDNSGGVTITSLTQHALPLEFGLYERNFWPYLMKIIQTHELKKNKQTSEMGVMCQLEPSPKEHSKNKKKKCDNKTPANECDCRLLPAEVTWVNTALARLMYDVTRDPVMIARVQHRIQRKLCTLKLPSFMSPLVVTELSLAGACPLVERVLPVSCDARGVWLDADLRYDGGAFIALSTQINLMKLKKKNVTLEEQMLLATVSDNVMDPESNKTLRNLFSEKNLKRKPAIYDSECEDSAESSSDDESPPVHPVDSSENLAHDPSTPRTSSVPLATSATEGGSSKKKFLRMVDKIAMNKYFQQVTDYKYVKRAMEGLSNTDIKLHLEVHCLEGRLCLNLPPPPHDRIWVGFRTNPQLVLKARPAVGARTLRFAHISNWIEQKLSKEFEKVLVLPNMEDFVIDVMTPTPVQFE